MSLRVFVTAILLVLGCAANAAVIRVSQESASGVGDFDANVLGFINAFDSGLTASAYYNYNNIPASFDDGAVGRVTLTSNKSHFFFVNASDGLAAFIVHDKPNDGAGGQARMTLDLAGDTAAVLVQDDIGEGIVSGGPTNFQTIHNWVACCTDGFVIGALDGAWALFAEFDSRSWGDFAGWMAFDGSTTIALTDDLDRRVRFDVVPEPGTMALLGIALAGLGFARRRSR